MAAAEMAAAQLVGLYEDVAAYESFAALGPGLLGMEDPDQVAADEAELRVDERLDATCPNLPSPPGGASMAASPSTSRGPGVTTGRGRRRWPGG
jgi:hypothetical protein